VFPLIVAFSVAVPSYPLPAWDDYLVTQPYPGFYSAGVSCQSGEGFMLAEDCYPEVDFIPYQVELWLGFVPPSTVGQYNFAFQLDQAAKPEGISFWCGTEDDVSFESIGLFVWGLYFYHVVVDIENPPTLAAGQPCWFCFQAVSSSSVACLLRNNMPGWYYQCCFSDDNGETWENSQSTWGTAYGVYLIISGATGLERATWGSIKGCFI
jgi:hypothetical protein